MQMRRFATILNCLINMYKKYLGRDLSAKKY